MRTHLSCAVAFLATFVWGSERAYAVDKRAQSVLGITPYSTTGTNRGRVLCKSMENTYFIVDILANATDNRMARHTYRVCAAQWLFLDFRNLTYSGPKYSYNGTGLSTMASKYMTTEQTRIEVRFNVEAALGSWENETDLRGTVREVHFWNSEINGLTVQLSVLASDSSLSSVVMADSLANNGASDIVDRTITTLGSPSWRVVVGGLSRPNSSNRYWLGTSSFRFQVDFE